MKIIAVTPPGRQETWQSFVIGDSAIIRNDKPFFLPDFAEKFTARAALAIKVTRLGKTVARRYAHRYCTEIAAAVTVTPRGIHEPQQVPQFSALATAFDGALLLGDFIEVGKSDINSALVSTECNGVSVTHPSPATAGILYEELVETLSRHFTLKMGDLIVIITGNDEQVLKAGQTLNAKINNMPNLTIRIK